MIIFSTSNAGKFTRFSQELAPYGLTAEQRPLEIDEPQEISVPEVARYKAQKAFEMCRCPVVVEDSGLCIPELNNFPEALTKPILTRLGIDGLLTILSNLKNRDCFFISSLGYADKDGNTGVIISEHERGELLLEPRGELHKEAWSALSYIFRPTGFRTSMADMTRDELNELYDQWRPENVFNKFAKLASENRARFNLPEAA